MNRVDFLIRETLKAKYNLETAEYGDCLDDKGRDVGIYFLECCKELAKTRDKKAILCLLDFFEDKFDIKYGGVLESLTNYIMDNFSHNFVFYAFCEKFENLINKNLWRFALISRIYFDGDEALDNDEIFDSFRKTFNSVKSRNSGAFIEKLSKNFGKNYRDGIKQRIELLREDMKKW
jgi:hypothetical protein